MIEKDGFNPIKWDNAKGVLVLLDQRALPLKSEYIDIQNVKEGYFAIKDMIVRGAPAIGITAAYCMLLSVKANIDILRNNKEEGLKLIKKDKDYLDSARPTAVNLVFATNLLYKTIEEVNHKDYVEVAYEMAKKIHEDDIKSCQNIGRFSSPLVKHKATILTHCNAGGLATSTWGTALAVIKRAHYENKKIFVYADETRPRLQGAKLTSYELVYHNIPSKLIADNAAATLIAKGKVDLVVVGADRIAANGDTCNKIGTFSLSCICKMYGVPFYVAAPKSTFDFNTKSGDKIPIEERSPEEVSIINNERITPEEMQVYNPAFDVTPYQHVSAFITDYGLIYPPFDKNIKDLKKK